MKKALIFTGLAILLVGLPLVAKFNRGGDVAEVEIQPVERKVIKSSILASGTLAYREQVQLRSEVIAQVREVHVEESDRVHKGDPVISLVTETYDAQVEQAEARVRMQAIAIERQKLLIKNLERRHDNQAELLKNKLVDQDSFDNLENDLEVARVDLRSQQEGLSQARAALAQAEDLRAKTRIVSPIDGLVIQVDVKVGETVIAGTTNIPGSTLVVIADPSEMLVEVKVDEADIAQVRVGQKADVYAAAYPDTPLSGTVESIAPTAQQATGSQSLSFLVKILLDEQGRETLRSGMSARVDIYTETATETLAVPIQAVLYDDEPAAGETGEESAAGEEQAYVFLMQDGKAVRHNVKTGISSDSDEEIVAGVTEGDKVIVGPFRTVRHLKEGERVEEKSPDAEADHQ